MEQGKHRAWAEIDLNAIAHNFRIIQQYVGDTPVLAVVKANAYGHGSVRVAQRLVQAGATYFAVATLDEAVELRMCGITLPILVLGYVYDADALLLAQYDLTATVYDRQTAELFSAAALQTGKSIRVHVALDTGMTRLGFAAQPAQQAAKEIVQLERLPGLILEGLFTHFAVSDTPDGTVFTQQQLHAFCAVEQALQHAGIHIPFRHCANSGGVLQYKNGYFDMVRAGILLYGYHPDVLLPRMLDLRPAMTLKARVVQVRDVLPGQTISYGRTYTAEKHLREAVISIGYADGYLRTGSNRVQMMVDGKKASVLGRICMDMCMVEVPHGASAARGDEVIVFGNGAITADDVAVAAETISYEVLCAVSARVPRIYTD